MNHFTHFLCTPIHTTSTHLPTLPSPPSHTYPPSPLLLHTHAHTCTHQKDSGANPTAGCTGLFGEVGQLVAVQLLGGVSQLEVVEEEEVGGVDEEEYPVDQQQQVAGQ